MSKQLVWNPDSGAVLFLGAASDMPIGGFAIERRETMPDGSVLVSRTPAPMRHVPDDFEMPSPEATNGD